MQRRVKEDQSAVEVLLRIRGIRVLTLAFVSAKQRYDTFLRSGRFKPLLDGRRSSRRPFQQPKVDILILNNMSKGNNSNLWRRHGVHSGMRTEGRK